jgi:hypothetical protein
MRLISGAAFTPASHPFVPLHGLLLQCCWVWSEGNHQHAAGLPTPPNAQLQSCCKTRFAGIAVLLRSLLKYHEAALQTAVTSQQHARAAAQVSRWMVWTSRKEEAPKALQDEEDARRTQRAGGTRGWALKCARSVKSCLAVSSMRAFI